MRNNIFPFKSMAIFLFSLLAAKESGAQRIRMLADPRFKNFYDIKAAFETDWQKKHGDERLPAKMETFKKKSGENEKFEEKEEANEKDNEYIQFKRWEDFVMPRVYPSGDLSLLTRTYANFKEYEEAGKVKRHVAVNAPAGTTGVPAPAGIKVADGYTVTTAGTWSFVGPPGTNTNGRNAGRMNFIRFDPTNTSIVYAGSPAGGLWKSTDGGGTWTTNTDYLPSVGCSDLAIDPTNTSVMYLATGDGDAGDTKSIGLLKTTDGGTTWSTTGLSFTEGQLVLLSRVIVNPSNPNIVIAAGTSGIYRSTDAGATFTQVYNDGSVFRDAEFKPDNPNIVYAGSNSMFRSTDGGATFTMISNGVPTSDIGRISIAVTANQTSYVYALITNGAGDMKGFYCSTDSGATYTLRASTPNILGYDTSFSGNNQAYYDMGLSVSSVNYNYILANGVISYLSKDGGVTWAQANKDCVDNTLQMHWDIHYMEWVPGSATNAFAANDGGVYTTTNTSGCWTSMNQNNISVNQIYGFGMSATDPEIMISGHQDGATLVWTDGSYNNVLGGDGMQAFVDRTNSKTMYGELYLGGLCRSTDGGVNWTYLANNTGLAGLSGGWNTPWSQDPVTANTIWLGYDQVFKSTNQGDSWTQVGTIPGSGSMIDVKVAPANTQVVYAARWNELYVTKNGGSTWTSIIAGLPSLAITRVAISETNPFKAWVTFSGYSAGEKIYQTIDGGTTWTNISSGLPNLPCNVVQYVPGSRSDEIYVGCDIGVYYKHDSLSSWVTNYSGLPYAPVSDIHIYKPGNEIRVSTFGRGIWKAPLATDTVGTLTIQGPVIFPIAEAGTDKIVTLPVNYTTLTGSAYETNGQVQVVTWTQLSGPSSALIVSPHSLTCEMDNLVVGTYQFMLTATDSVGTNGMDTVSVTVNKATATNGSSTAASALTLYPVPANDLVVVNYPAITVGVLAVFDEKGRMVLTKQLEAASVTASFSVRSLSAGAYFVRIVDTNNGDSYKLKMVVAH